MEYANVQRDITILLQDRCLVQPQTTIIMFSVESATNDDVKHITRGAYCNWKTHVCAHGNPEFIIESISSEMKQYLSLELVDSDSTICRSEIVF